MAALGRLGVPVAVVAGGVVLGYPTFRALAAVIGSRGSERGVRSLLRVAIIGVPLVGFGVLWLAGVPALVDAALAPVGPDLPGSWVDAVCWPVVTGWATTPVALAAYLGVHPEAARLRDADQSRRTGAIRVARYLLVVTVVVVVAIRALLAAATGPAWRLALVVAAGLTALELGGPLLVRALHPIRDPTADERAVTGAALDVAGITPHGVRVSAIGDTERAWIDVRGPPGRRTLFLSDYAIDHLDAETLGALVRAHWERHRRFHREIRVVPVLVVLSVALWLLGRPSPGPATLVTVGAVVALPVSAWVASRVVYRADRAAAEAVGGVALAAALRRGGDLHEVDVAAADWGPTGVLVKAAPSLRDRIRAVEPKDAGEAAATEPGD